MSEGDKFIGMTLEELAETYRKHVPFTNPSAQFVPHPASKIGNHNHDAAAVPPAFKVDTPLDAFTAIREELVRAAPWGPFNSLHEAYGVIDEEFDEFRRHVYTNQKKRDLPACRAELVQLAAMAIKGIECIDAGGGRV